MIFYLRIVLFIAAILVGVTEPKEKGIGLSFPLVVGFFASSLALDAGEKAYVKTEEKIIEYTFPKFERDLYLTPKAKQTLDPFQKLIENSDLHPHIMVVGKSGSGKSTIAQYLVSFCPGKKFAISPHFDAAKIATEWSSCDGILGIGRNYGSTSDEVLPYNEIVEGKHDVVSCYQCLLAIFNEMTLRYTTKDGFENLEVHHWFIDEVPAISSSLGKTFADLLKPLIFEARKVNIRLWLITQTDQVETLGIKGQGKIRDNFTYIYLNDAAKAKHMQLFGTRNYTNTWDWCIVNEEVAKRPGRHETYSRLVETVNSDRFITKFPIEGG